LIQFGCQSGPIFASKSTKIHPKVDSKKHHNFNGFLDRFFEVFGLQLGPNLAPKTAQEPPKIAQEAPKTAQGPPRTAPKTLSRHPWDRSGTCQNAQERFSTIFGEILTVFGTILRRILDDF